MFLHENRIQVAGGKQDFIFLPFNMAAVNQFLGYICLNMHMEYVGNVL